MREAAFDEWQIEPAEWSVWSLALESPSFHYVVMDFGFLGKWAPGEAAAAISGLAAGAIAALLLYRFVRGFPWPRPFRLSFLLVHLVGAVVFGFLWVLLSIAFESLYTGSMIGTRTMWRVVNLPHELPQISLLLYAIIIGVGYSVEGRARTARLEADAVRAQLAALRTQLHPHFLFNALHAVVQLIQVDPARATEAAELVASLLRVTLEENRDEVTLGDEWNFVSRYLEVEHIRFGDKLRVRADINRNLFDERVPSFALQTLVENAVRHGAEKRVTPTEIVVSASADGGVLKISVWNESSNLPAVVSENGAGTGLTRLRERLSYLYGKNADLLTSAAAGGGYQATLTLPRTSSS